MSDPEHNAAPGGTHQGRRSDTTSEADNLTTESIAETHGYGAAVDHYRRRGWQGILPITASGKKYPPPTKFTGHTAPWPSGANIAEWQDQYAENNVALRVPENVIGIDVDAYDTKNGAATLAHAENLWGPLTPTIMSTSRDDGVSAIRLYRLPTDQRARRSVINFGPGLGDIEIVRTGHRYAMVWPSIHPDTGTQYQWRNPDWTVRDTIPTVADLTELPAGWIDPMCHGDDATLGAVDITAAVRGLTTGPVNGRVQDRLDTALRDLLGGTGSRHDTTLGHVMALLRLSEQGETGVVAALEQLRAVYTHTVQDRLTSDEAADEFNRMVTNDRAHQMIAATPTITLHDM
ncbi:MAG: bifunctional DNA primase/polymerase, partial [Gordonia paraffinivorans]